MEGEGIVHNCHVFVAGVRICVGARMKYGVAFQKTDEGYSVSVPGLPGCWSQGATEEEAIANIQDAIKEYLAAREELKSKCPTPKA